MIQNTPENLQWPQEAQAEGFAMALAVLQPKHKKSVDRSQENFCKKEWVKKL